MTMTPHEQLLHVTAVKRLHQERADNSLQPWGVSAPVSKIDENVDAYRRRLLSEAQQLLPDDHEYRNVPVDRMPHDVLPGYEDWIYSACKQFAYDPSTVPVDAPLREVKETDPNGLRVTRFIGQRSFIHDFTTPGRRVASFNTSNGPMSASGMFLR
jgi:hypothetical protein